MECLQLSSIFNDTNLRNRASVSLIRERICDNEVVLDFNKIDFISKSFSHELLSYLKSNGYKAHFKNVNKSVDSVLRIAFSKPKINLKITNVRID